MEGETLLPLKCPNCFRMTASREPFDSSVGLVPINALVLSGLAHFRVVGNPKFDSLPRRRCKVRLPMIHAVR
jgi:hypothetical protein